MLTIEAEATLILLPVYEQDHIRHQVAHNIGRLYKQQENRHTNNTIQMKKDKKS
jgi:hypothetical protein